MASWLHFLLLVTINQTFTLHSLISELVKMPVGCGILLPYKYKNIVPYDYFKNGIVSKTLLMSKYWSH
jgi:hypothetical protein